jgi:hypothetical protein
MALSRRSMLSKGNKGKLRIATVSISSSGQPQNHERTMLLDKVLNVLNGSAHIILLPGGFYEITGPARFFGKIARSVQGLLQATSRDVYVCCGIDGRRGKDQIAIAIGRNGISAAGRKFHPTKSEKGWIKPASSPNDGEGGYPRIFKADGKRIYLAVCYDVFGIKHQSLRNPSVDLIFGFVHGFYPREDGNSSETYFAKHGFAGASKQWKVPTYGAAVFFDRDIPPRWADWSYLESGE